MRSKVTRNPIVLDGHVVGQSVVIESEDGDPVFGRCWVTFCPNTATFENLMAVHLCDDCFSRYYSPDGCEINPDREFDLELP